MTAYRRVYDSHQLQADCHEPGSAPETTFGNRVWASFRLPFYTKEKWILFSASRCSTIITVAYRVVSHSNSRRPSRLLCRRKFHRHRTSVWHAELTVIHSQSRQQFELLTPSIRSSDISSCDVTKPTSRYNCHVVGIARYNENPMGIGTEVCQQLECEREE